MLDVIHVDRLTEMLRTRLTGACADGILLSGGLDTSVLAAFAAERGRPVAVTVCVRPEEAIDEMHRRVLAGKLGCSEDVFPSPDAMYARQCAEALGLTHDMVWVTLDELLAFAPGVIKAIRSFDPMQVRNGLTIYCGLMRAKALGLTRILTGDGADEMYAGYSHMWTMAPEALAAYLRHMATIMHFTTPELAAAVGIDTVSPFTETELTELALQLPHEAFIGTQDGRVMGKWIIREAVRDRLPASLVWRVKTPIEYGSGSTFTGPLLASRTSDREFADAQAHYGATGLRLRDKEQLYYYRIYETLLGPISTIAAPPDGCPYCGSAIVPANRNYCGTCGAWGFQHAAQP